MSKKLHTIVTSYYGSLFVGHCTADDLVDYIFEFVKGHELDLNLLLALGIAGPNVNKSFKSKLAKELQKRGATHFLDAGTCSIHIVTNAFLEGIKCLKGNVNVDQFAIDLHFLFKLSGARREDYRGVSELTDATMDHNKPLPNPLAQPGQSASDDYRTVQKFEGIFFSKHCLRCLDLKGKTESIELNVTKELRMS